MENEIKNGRYKEYIENKDTVIDILNKHKFNMEYSDVCKNDMECYKFKIDRYTFDYFEGMAHDVLNDDNKMEKCLNALWCILTDYQSSDDIYLEDFISNMGYEYREGNKIYNLCIKQNEKLEKIFTRDEIQTLIENISL